ncbi:hypothetical protein EDC96DRAFT_514358 [Choanephora cucurbitarum]|nr:hypothetical protein EDC96DRAFT_514358 [Choanephora cucurbitarum]
MRQFALIALALVVCLVDTAFGEIQTQAQANSKRGLLDNGSSGGGDLTGSLTKGLSNGLIGGGSEHGAQTESTKGHSRSNQRSRRQ